MDRSHALSWLFSAPAVKRDGARPHLHPSIEGMKLQSNIQVILRP